MYRFFITPEKIKDGKVHFPSDIAHQITHVLRLGEGDQVMVLDNQGAMYYVKLVEESNRTIHGKITHSDLSTNKNLISITLLFGMTSRNKVEWILQKGTEVGVTTFQPFISSRTLVQSTSLAEKKEKRWETIIREAAEQSGQLFLPKLNQPVDFKTALKIARNDHDLCLLAWEHSPDDRQSLSRALSGFTSGRIALLVGPEGGFSDDEVKNATKRGCTIVSLGESILRMETAAIVFPALVHYELSGKNC